MKGQQAYILAKSIHEKMYSATPGLKQEDKRALYYQYLQLIKKAAYQGHLESLYDFANQFEDIGYLGSPNPLYSPQRCIYWYTKASSKGHAEACNNLATFYESGKGCTRDLHKALELYRRSASLGSPNGKKNYKIMLRDMSDKGKYGIASKIGDE